MKIRLLSDLHLEHKSLPIYQGGEDVVVLAGDVATGINGIEWAKRTFTVPVIYVAGNHEFYGHDFDQLIPALWNAACDSHVHFLENEQITLDGVRFIGSTLWTDFNLYRNDQIAMLQAENQMEDFAVILETQSASKPKRLKPVRTKDRFHQSLNYLTQTLSKPFNGKTIVVTHHLPTEQSVPKKFRGNLLSPAFASNLEIFILDRPQINYWLHGHTHASCDFMLDGTRVLCNPAGYPMGDRRENDLFELECILQVS